MSPKQILTEALALIDTPETWCQEDYAQDNLGLPVSTLSEEACCFCGYGAIARVTGLDTHDPKHGGFDARVTTLLNRAANDVAVRQSMFLKGSSITSFVALNDGHYDIVGMTTHEAVRASFQRAIELAGE